jgi:hypothetical protein
LASLVAFAIGVQFGITGVAIAIVVRAYLFWPVRMLALRAATGMPLGTYFEQWLRPVCCGLGMVLAMVAAREVVPDPARFTAEAIAGAVTYGALLWFIAPEGFRELTTTAHGVLPSRGRPAMAPPPG